MTPTPLLTTDHLNAALAGAYAIERELGRGGMATVYLAHDIKHDRDVAIKVLHPDLGAALGGERFLSEIRTTARLQHPHILPLLDSGDADGLLYYVMPLVTGETLRARLERERQLPVPDAVRIAREVASALDYAHRQNVIHRDIKPENILLHDGQAIVADFGIALAVQSAGGARMTQTGISLGTPQYMSPEQAMGERTIDARSDIYALGAVTYEMLAGDAPFTGSSVQAIVAKVLSEKPTSLHTLRDTVPSYIERAVFTALAKLPADRYASAAEFATALSPVSAQTFAATASSTQAGTTNTRRARWTLGVAGAALLAIGAVGGMLVSKRAATSSVSVDAPVEFDFESGPPIDAAGVSISRDGRLIVTQGRDTLGRRAIVLRDVAHARTSYLATSDEPHDPRISPDGRWIAYGSGLDRSIRKISVEGGPSTQLTTDGSSEISWIGSDSVIFWNSGRGQKGLWMVSAKGGRSRQVVARDSSREFSQAAPFSIPNPRVALFCNYSAKTPRIDAVDLDRGTRTTVLESACSAVYAASGHLIFSRGDALYAIRFDSDRLKTMGEAERVVDGVFVNPSAPGHGFDVSNTGTLVYRRAVALRWPRQLVFRSRDGSVQPALPTAAAFSEPRLSPDGRMVLVTVQSANKSLALVDVLRRTMSPLLKGSGDVFDAQWFPDGRSFAYVREGFAYDIYRASVDGSVPDTPLLQTAADKYPSGVSPSGLGIWLDNDTYPASFAFADTAIHRLYRDGTWGARATPSPNGRWVALESHSGSGVTNVVIMAADGTGPLHRVSLDGGEEACWTKGGRELVYRVGTAMMVVAVDPQTGEASTPTLLFRAPLAPNTESRTRSYDVSADGSRFVMVDPVPGAPPSNVVTVGFLKAMQRR